MSKSQRLWLVIGFIVTLIFFFMFTSPAPNRSPGRDRPSTNQFEENLRPRDIMATDILLFAVTIGATLLTFHPVYGGLSPKHRLYCQLALIALYTLSVMSIGAISPLRGSGSADELSRMAKVINVISILLPILFVLYFIGIPMLLSLKYFGALHTYLDVCQWFAPRNPNLFITRAWVYQHQGEYEKTIQAADRALELTPRLKKKEDGAWFAFDDWRLINAHTMRMVAYFNLAQHDLALEDAEIVVRFQPKNPASYINRSLALRRQGDFAAAEADLNTAEQLKPDDYYKAFLLYSRAGLMVFQNHYQEALKLYQAAFNIPLPEPQKKALHPEIWCQIGMVELHEGHDTAAEHAFTEAKTINPEISIVGLVALHAKRGDWEQAEVEWQNVIKSAPLFKRIDILKRQFPNDPIMVGLVEEVIARQEPKAA